MRLSPILERRLPNRPLVTRRGISRIVMQRSKHKGDNMDTVRDRLWIWGHEAASHNTGWGLPAPSRMTPLEGAAYLGIPNMIMVRYEGKPAMPYDQYALALRPLKRIYWSTVGAGGENSDAERQHVIELAKRFPNIVGIFMDDFFHDPGYVGDLGVMSLEQIAAMKAQMQAAGRRLTLGVTLYTHQLDQPLTPYLAQCDHISLWTWKARDLVDMQANLAKLEELAPHSRKLLGLYMWDYGTSKPMPLDLMQMQAETGLRWLREGRVDGLIFLASCICDLELEAVEWSRAWIARAGEQTLA
jgi:hypothetical protein